MGTGRLPMAAGRRLDALVAGTPGHRDRYVDLLRVVAIGVVVVWHWTLSVVYWSGGRFVMPNPIHAVPGAWLATWLLQVVPVFFIVGGYANSAALRAARRDGRGVTGFLRSRLRRLLVPVGWFVVVWTGFEGFAHLAVPGYPGVLSYGLVVFTPLWFIAAYLWVVLLTPLTAAAHARARWLTAGGLAAAVAVADLARFGLDLTAAGWVNSALVWVLVHQLGYFLRDGTLAAAGRAAGAGLVAAGLAGLAALTALPAYPRSMVAAVGQERSNIFPTTASIVLVAILQLGVILLVRAPVTGWLRRPGVWRLVVAGNAVIMTVFVWHMTALLVVLAAALALDVPLRTEPDAAWWATRPLWLVAPLVVLAVLVAVFGRVEIAGTARGSRSTGTMSRGG